MQSTSSSSKVSRVKVGQIRVRGARVNNLKSVNLDIPYNRLTLFCGPSGGGKSSLALNVLYAEGQRRYVECFAPSARALLQRFEKPNVDYVEGLPPAIAVTSHQGTTSPSATVGGATEIFNYLRLLLSSAGKQYCRSCGHEVIGYSPESIWDRLLERADGVEAMICFTPRPELFSDNQATFEESLRKEGFRLVVVDGETFDLNDPQGIPTHHYRTAKMLQNAWTEDDRETTESLSSLGVRVDNTMDELSAGDDPANSADDTNDAPRNNENAQVARVLLLDPERSHSRLKNFAKTLDESRKLPPPRFYVVVEQKIVIGKNATKRALEALETAYRHGGSLCWIMLEGRRDPYTYATSDSEEAQTATLEIVGKRGAKTWTATSFSAKRRCSVCRVDYPEPNPNLFSYSTTAGACVMCGGEGFLTEFNEDLVFPDKKRSLNGGAVAPWRVKPKKNVRSIQDFVDEPFANDLQSKDAKIATPTKYQQLLARYVSNVPIANDPETGEPIALFDVPVEELTLEQRRALFNGSPTYGTTGINGFLTELLKEKYKMHIRVFLSRYQKQIPCFRCHGERFSRDALTVRFADKTFLDFSTARVSDALATLQSATLSHEQEKRVGAVFRQICSRLRYLERVGLGYLTLERQLNSLSAGERRRVDVAKAIGSDLVDMLYVLDEPTIGLHPSETKKLANALLDLRDRGNTVVVIDHAQELFNLADKVVEFSESGGAGGQILFDGKPQEMLANPDSLTGGFLTGKTPDVKYRRRDVANCDFLEINGATGYNLKKVNASFPLGTLCLVTGVSGAGKTALVGKTLYPALCQKISVGSSEALEPLPFESLNGYEGLEEILFVDQSPIGRSPRSNPVTYLRIFDEIRSIYAETLEARARGYSAGHFSFNIEGGRCETCRGEGYVQVDMKFMSDLYKPCPTCNGKRYRKPLLDVTFRNLNIAQTLDLTAQEAFVFFRGYPKIQQKLRNMIDVGLGRLRLGQSGVTLSAGEAQRLKLALRLGVAKRNSSLYILDEPSSGLYFSDVIRLANVLNELVDSGASLIVIDHNPILMRAADYIVDLGPGAGEEGGRVVAEGTPEEVARVKESRTGQILSSAPYAL